jgi:hypothetical protein
MIATTTREIDAAVNRARQAVTDLSSYSLWTIEEFQAKHEKDYELLWKHYDEPVVAQALGAFELLWRGDVETAGYIYCVSDQQGHYKLGRTKQLQPRLKTLGTQPPFKITLLFTHYVFNAALYEKRLHQRFASKRLNGEWFELNNDDLNSIKIGTWVAR